MKKMPLVGMGTFGSDHANPKEIAEAVITAVSLGYRHLDCASIYGNEPEIGQALKSLFSDNVVKREDLWITSKVWNNMHSNVIDSCKKSMNDLGLDYLDLFLVHWPFPNHHDAGCTGESRSNTSKPYIHSDFMKTWRQMEQLKTDGLVRNIGVSNMTIPKLQLLLDDAADKPTHIEMEMHPHFQQTQFLKFVLEKGIQPIGYCPIGSPNRPERDRTPEDTVDIEDPVIKEIGKKHGCHPVSVCLKWGVQRGCAVIPFSTKEKNLRSNLFDTLSDPLSDEEINQISKIDKNCRLIKGQVFLWKENQHWEDLWDVDGKIKN